MSAGDKLSNKIDDMGGKAKEAAGELTVYESVTSDSTTGTGEHTPLDLSMKSGTPTRGATSKRQVFRRLDHARWHP